MGTGYENFVKIGVQIHQYTYKSGGGRCCPLLLVATAAAVGFSLAAAAVGSLLLDSLRCEDKSSGGRWHENLARRKSGCASCSICVVIEDENTKGER